MGLKLVLHNTPLEIRANEIHSVNNVGARKGKTVIATALATTSAGERVTLVGSSEGGLRPEQNKMLRPNEIPVKGNSHAEINILNHAQANGMTVNKIAAAGSGICENCAPAIVGSGAVIYSPIRPATQDKTYVKPPVQLKLNF